MSNKRIALEELKNRIVTDQDGNQATLYEVISAKFDHKIDAAIEKAVQTGDFTQVSRLRKEMSEAISGFIQQGIFPKEEGLIWDPNVQI